MWRQRALSWVESMREPDSVCCYRLHEQAEPTVFASFFALFTLHLCTVTETWNEQRRLEWLEFVRNFQDEETGLFRDPGAASRVTDPAHDLEHLDRQLTGFSVSALKVVGGQPRYPIRAVWPWFDPDYMRRWLDGLDWKRSSNSGNKAMFIAIMLIDELERGQSEAARGLDAWFDWHDRMADPATSYWGTGRSCRYFQGMNGFVHQFLIYNYMDRQVPLLHAAVDRTLLLQQPDGLFSPMLGGGACDDLDALHVLCYAHHALNYRRADIGRALEGARAALLANQNPDGGFSWARRRLLSPGEWIRLAVHNSRTADPYPYLLYVALRLALAGQRHLRRPQRTGWCSSGWGWSESSIWDTWFRTLTIAEIDAVVDPAAARRHWRRIDAPNFGWFILP
ncbi:MAG: hypothetical protein ACE5HV_05380 [Acidobacteriota bacterium]